MNWWGIPHSRNIIKSHLKPCQFWKMDQVTLGVQKICWLMPNYQCVKCDQRVQFLKGYEASLQCQLKNYWKNSTEITTLKDLNIEISRFETNQPQKYYIITSLHHTSCHEIARSRIETNIEGHFEVYELSRKCCHDQRTHTNIAD